jgi:hypothetical protein
MRVHGKLYQGPDEVNARIAELNEGNLKYGASDGRVTEIQDLIGQLQRFGYEKTPRQEFEERTRKPRPNSVYAKPNPYMNEQVQKAQARIREIEADRSRDDGQWRYLRFQDNNGRNTRREYRTELGFLRGYVAAVLDGMDILIAE